jgi:undecaprenyl-diphosphatase
MTGGIKVAVWQAVVLGITQGLTEFLPVSSSGHLVIVQSLLAIPQGVTLPFDILLHWGTLLAVVLYFRQDLRHLLQGVFRREPASLRLFAALALGTVPAVLLGLLFKDFFERAFAEPLWIGGALLINGVILLAVNRFAGKGDLIGVRMPDALWIGLGQAAAIFPGISRSGSTIAAGLLRGLSREAAARFSFLLAIPVILGAGLLELKDLLNVDYQAMGAPVLWIGFGSAALSGYFVIQLFLNFLRRGSLRPFGYYCLALGAAALIWFAI